MRKRPLERTPSECRTRTRHHRSKATLPSLVCNCPLLAYKVSPTYSPVAISTDGLTVTVAISNNLHLGYTTRTAVWSFEGVQQAILEKAAVLLWRTRSFHVRRADVKRQSCARVCIRGSVGFLAVKLDTIRVTELHERS
jgi:hypothetical protein